DGIRDFHVTGVQTCALPILKKWSRPQSNWRAPQNERVRCRLRDATQLRPLARTTCAMQSRSFLARALLLASAVSSISKNETFEVASHQTTAARLTRSCPRR